MGSDILRSEAIQTMSESARQTIMLTDSSKFQKRGTIVQFKPFDISTLITDDGISQDLIDYFKRYRIQTILVKREEENN
jgi:DeoR/GlpR family transcriptional regulator of sugar metabolism